MSANADGTNFGPGSAAEDYWDRTRDELYAEIDRLRMRWFEDVTAARIELLTEVQALRAEVERMRPVIEAAEAWDSGEDFSLLAPALVHYWAVAALDAGEPQP